MLELGRSKETSPDGCSNSNASRADGRTRINYYCGRFVYRRTSSHLIICSFSLPRTKRLFQIISMCYERESKSGRSDAADRLSDLPDSLIIHILSFLRTKDAIRTGILSKRWRFLWTFVPTLSFHSGFHRSITKFRNFVERALILHHSSKLDNLLIEIPTFYTLTKPKQSLDDHINSCLRYAINRDVATLHLDFSYRIYMTGFPAQGSKRLLLPDFLYGHPSLTNLSTQMCDYAPRRRISWGLLRCLTIGLTELRDDVFSSILAGSPALEFLELHACWGFQVLDTGSSSLNKLKLTIDSLSLAAVKISAPNLKSLEILGSVSMNLELLNALALIDVDLSFTLSGDGVNGTFAHDIVFQLLHNIRCANKVVLGASVCKILFNIDAIEFSLPFKHTCLVLQLHVKDLDHALANLLQNSPTLETLVINIYGIYVTELSSNHKKYWSSLEAGRFLCLKQTLKTVKITGFRAGIMPFLEFLLVNAKVMEKTSIYFMKVWSHKDAIEKSELVKMAQKLPPSIPRPSNSKAVVEFHE